MKSKLREKILELLSLHQGSYIPQSYIHRALGVSKSRVSEILSELEKEGLINRVVVGRNKLIYIPPGITEKNIVFNEKILRLGIVYSSEYLFLQSLVKKLERKGFRVEITPFRDGLKLTRALGEGLIDIALSPLPSQLYLYPAYRNYTIILAGLKGGFRVLSLGGEGPIYSSMITTMDYTRHLLITEELIPASKTVYYDDPYALLKKKNNRGYVVTWHPVYLELESKGFKPIITPSDIDIHFCCTLAISNKLDERTRHTIASIYLSSIEEYRRNPEKGLEYYSLVTGIHSSILKSAVEEYRVAEDLDLKTVDEITGNFAPLIPYKKVYREGVVEKEKI